MADECQDDWVPEMVRSQRQWQATIDAITDYIFVTDRARRVIRANKSFSARFQRHPKDVVGLRVDELFGLEIPHTNCLLDRAFESRQSVVDETVVGADTYMISIFPVELGNDGAYVCVMKDITEMKAMRDQLYNTYKLASIGQLVSGVAHEINNPLTGILGFSELLTLRVKDEMVLKEVEKIHRAAERCKVIVESLLCFSRQQKPHRSLEYINDIIDKTIDLRTYWHKSKDLDLVKEYGEIPMIFIDAQQIQHAILNILMNAEQAVLAAGRKGRITISTVYDREAKKIIITIADNGAGIPDHIRGRIFDPFFTTKPVGEGSGLGLSMTYGIITEHGGTISVGSSTEEGTAFIVELPVVKPSESDI
ncbi:MAG: ATP-binding protein [Nitrospiraceae bacterium]|nr:ATP-binding protein [Nitrospiraceae bacterium]